MCLRMLVGLIVISHLLTSYMILLVLVFIPLCCNLECFMLFVFVHMAVLVEWVFTFF